MNLSGQDLSNHGPEAAPDMCASHHTGLVLGGLAADAQASAVRVPMTIQPAHMSEAVARLLIADQDGRSRLNHVVADGGNTLHFAIKKGDIQLARFALENGADPNLADRSGNRPLHLAAEAGTPGMTTLLLQSRADPNLLGGLRMVLETQVGHSSHLSPLHIAVTRNHSEVAKELLDGGADANAIEPFRFWTPLLLAVHAGLDSMVHLLLANGANVDGHAHAFATPFMVALTKERMDLVQTLYCCGADLNRKDGDGDPAISSAAADGLLGMVKFILGVSGNSLDLRGASGRPPWWFAQKFGHAEIRDLLREATQEREGGPLREFPPDVLDDSTKSVETIGMAKVLNDIAQAQRHSFAVPNSGVWRNRIRFVVEAPPGQKDYTLEVIEPYIDGNNSHEPYLAVSYCWASLDTYQGEDVFIKAPQTSGGGSTIRPTRARPDFILRCLQYARSKGIHRIWIDQECIHQDDDEDKRLLVGTMHRIYRQATLTLAVLGNHIMSVEDVEAVKYLKAKVEPPPEPDTESTTKTSAFEHSRILCRRILEDKWFNRAWTTQEAFSARWDSDNLVYLVGWERNFDRAGSQWQAMMKLPAMFPEQIGFPRQMVPRNLVLDSHDIWSMSVVHTGGASMMTTVTQKLWDSPQKTFTLSAVDWHQKSRDSSWRMSLRRTSRAFSDTMLCLVKSAKVLWRRRFLHQTSGRRCDADFSNHKTNLTGSTLAQVHAMAMSTAFFSLAGKRNLMTSDRPSIFANLTDFQQHINMTDLLNEEPGISYTACVLALSLVNGDLSFLLDNNHWSPSEVPHSSDPSWLPSSLRLGNPRFPPRHLFEGRVTPVGHPCVLVGRSLVAPGILWKIAPCSDLRRLQDGVRKSVERCKLQPADSWHEGVAVLKATLRELFRQKRERMIPLVVSLARKKKWETPAEMDQALRKLKKWYLDDRGTDNWPRVVEPTPFTKQDRISARNRTSVRIPEIEPSDIVVPCSEEPIANPGADDKLLEDIPHCWGDGLLRWVYLTVLKGVPFALGTLANKLEQLEHADGPHTGAKGSACQEEHAIFKLQLKDQDQAHAFVPMAQLNYEFGGDAFLYGVAESAASFWHVRPARVVDPSTHAEAARMLKGKGVETPRIAKMALAIERTSNLLGFWSPFLSSSGVLAWNQRAGTYRMNRFDNLITYHMII